MTMTRRILPVLLLSLLAACGQGSDNDGHNGNKGTPGTTPVPDYGEGTAVTLSAPQSLTSERDELTAELSELSGLDAAGLVERFPTKFEAAPSYDLTQVQGLDLIQASSVGLSQPELDVLANQGFVISGSKWFPSFAYGYSTIYAADLPVYVSADSILSSVHRSYDDILKQLEVELLSSELTSLLDGMRGGLAEQTSFGAEMAADADVFLAVARSLLQGYLVDPVAGGDAATVKSLFDKATAASGWEQVELFGIKRDEDFSQFKPRGHYTESEALERYFRATMWLGRIDFRLIETQQDGSSLFRRRQFDAMLALHQLVNSELATHFDRIDRAVAAFVGEPDYMVLSQVGSLLGDLGATSLSDTAALGDEQIAQAIIDGGYGTQRISSHIMINGTSSGTLPLSSSFALMGQRYVLDSHVFSNVVYDRVASGSVKRMMPNPLDAAFAALGNDQAAELLRPELESYPYAPDLAGMRLLADSHPAEYWQENLYNLWLGSLRTLAPAATSGADDASELPPVARSEAWGRRLLNTELSSWAELRHDTILYVKQSYTGGATCEFPDAYVDPYPEFYAAVEAYAAKGVELATALDLAGTGAASLEPRLNEYFQNLGSVAGRLREMAEHERTGSPFTDEMLAFINEAVVISGGGCGGPPTIDSGWYRKLFFEEYTALEFDPTIADVHTQPTDEGGASVGRVLHVGTGPARSMVVITEGCSGPRAYAGLAASYYERITENFERLTDEQWITEFDDGAGPSDVPWMSDLVVH